MAKSDLDALLERARNHVGCPVTDALNKLPADERDKFRAAFIERAGGDSRQWAFIGTELARILAARAGVGEIHRRAIENYRRKHG